MSDGVPFTGGPDQDKLDEVEALLRGSDAGSVDYDEHGNPLYSDEKAKEAHENALARQDAEAQGLVLDENPEDQAQPQETETTEADADESQAEAKEETPKVINYDDHIEVPLPDGREAISIGKLKDEYVDMVRTRETLDAAQSELATERLIVNEILRDGGEVSGERITQLQQLNSEQFERDRQTILQMYPIWQTNAEVRERDFQAMIQAGVSIGATESELKQISKPWLIRALKELSDYKAREAKGVKAVKAVPMRKPVARKAPPQQPTARGNQFAKVLDDAKGNLEGADFETLDKVFRGTV